MWERARACNRGSPRSAAEKDAGCGGPGREPPPGPSLRGQLRAKRSAPHFAAGVPRAPDHPGSQHWENRAPRACFCCGRLGKRGGGRQERLHSNLETCSQSVRRSSPRENRRGLELRRAKASPARSGSPRRRAETDPAVPWRRCGALPPVPRAHAGDKARIGGCLTAGAPAVARAAIRGAETTLYARSWASGAAEESIIQSSSSTASSSPGALR